MHETDAPPGPSPLRYRALGVLLLAYIFSFVDRQIVGILAPAIKADLGLTDTQLGMLGGLAFAILYTSLGLPVAWLADRKNRVWIITIALTLWSAFTALCGLAANFTQLFLARLGVGVGEAGGTAPAYSLISDYFPRAERGRALAFYSLGVPIGNAAGILFGGLIASAIDWRLAFIVVGLAGIAVAPILRLAVPEPPRGRYDPPAAKAGAMGMGETLALLARKPAFWGLSLGGAAAATLNYGTSFWLPSFLVRSFGLPLHQVSLLYAGVMIVAGTAGVWIGGWLADRFGARSPAAYAVVPAVLLLIAMPSYAAFALSTSVPWAVLFVILPQAFGLAWMGPIIAAVQHLAPAAGRTTASAAFLFVNNLIGLGTGTLFFGAVSDALSARFGAEALRYAILSGLVFYVVSAGILLATSRRLGRDLV